MDTMENSSPEFLMIMGKVVSMVVAPPAEMGDSFPKYFTIQGARRRVMTSRMMLAKSEIVNSSAHLYSEISTLESE